MGLIINLGIQWWGEENVEFLIQEFEQKFQWSLYF